MTNIKRKASLDEVLSDYAHSSQEFDAKVLQAFIERYPEHSEGLRRYAHIQLTSLPASPEEIDNELLSAEEMLPRQSKLLQRMQQLRGTPSAADVSEAINKLASVSGETALEAAAIAVFGSSEHGEDLLLISVTDSASDVSGVPDWFYHRLGEHVGAVPTALVAGMAMKRQQPLRQQRFSTKDKPAEPPPTTWEQAVEDCISDDLTKKSILNRLTGS